MKTVFTKHLSLSENKSLSLNCAFSSSKIPSTLNKKKPLKFNRLANTSTKIHWLLQQTLKLHRIFNPIGKFSNFQLHLQEIKSIPMWYITNTVYLIKLFCIFSRKYIFTRTTKKKTILAINIDNMLLKLNAL